MLVEACLIVYGLSSEFNMVTFEGCFCQLRCVWVIFFFSVIELVHDLYLRVGKTGPLFCLNEEARNHPIIIINRH